MRKIEEQMAQALHADRNWHSGNTEVRIDDTGTAWVYLHGNLIAHRQHGLWLFRLAGWNTPTTRSRINAIAREYGAHGVSCKAGTPYSNGRAVTSDQWF